MNSMTGYIHYTTHWKGFIVELSGSKCVLSSDREHSQLAVPLVEVPIATRPHPSHPIPHWLKSPPPQAIAPHLRPLLIRQLPTRPLQMQVLVWDQGGGIDQDDLLLWHQERGWNVKQHHNQPSPTTIHPNPTSQATPKTTPPGLTSFVSTHMRGQPLLQ